MPDVETKSNPKANPYREMLTIAQIVENPRLARIYTYLYQQGSRTVDEICDELELADATAYQDIKNLAELRVLEKKTKSRPHHYQAKPISLQLGSDNEITAEVGPTFIAAVAQQEDNQNIDLYIERHGLHGLATALEYAKEYIEGTMNARIMARELDITPLEAETILQELRDVIQSVDTEHV